MDESTLSQNPKLDDLLADWEWLGELAARIVRDTGLREDARQAAWLSMTTGQSQSSPRRARLYWAVKQFASNARLADRRRARRERVAAQREALPSTEELVHRGEQRQRVWDAAMELPEPLRGSLLLHYQDGLSPAEIAARSGVKADTVRRRIQRGVQQIRERLSADTEGGGLLALAAALPRSRSELGALSLPAPPAALAATLLAGTMMLAKTLCAVGAVAALFFAARAITQTDPVPAPSKSTSAPLVERDPVGLETVLESDKPIAIVAPLNDQREELLPSQSEVTADPIVATWGGTVVLHDPQGNVLSAEPAGTLNASISIPMEGRTFRSRGTIEVAIPIRAGRFEVAVTQDHNGTWSSADLNEDATIEGEGTSASELVLLVSGAESSGLGPLVLMESASGLTVQRSRRIAFGDDEPVLHVRSIDPVIVHVLDSQNPKAHLTQVEVTAGGGETDRPEIATHSRKILASSEASPITLQPELSEACVQSVGCFFYSPGYARKRVELDLSNGGERVVELEPGGNLHVAVQGTIPRDSYLRVWVDEERWAPFSNLRIRKEGDFELQGLPVGPSRVRLEIGSYYGETIVLAEEEVLIQAGARASLSLVAREFATVPAVEVAGTFELPTAWEEAEWRIQMRRVSPTTGSDSEFSFFRVADAEAISRSSDNSLGYYPFSAGELVPGDYVATVIPIELKTAFTVPPEGLVNLRIEVPPPARLTVTVRDSLTGEISDVVGSLSWLPVYEGPSVSTIYPSARRDEATRTFALNVPVGPVEISASGLEIARATTTVHAVDGMSVELEVTRVARARVEFQHEGRHVPWPSDAPWEFPCSRVDGDGDGEVLQRGSNQAGIRFSVTTPGLYRLTLPKPEGFQQPEPVEIELAIEEEQRVIVPLTPE